MDKEEFLKLFKECLEAGNIKFELDANGYKPQQFDVRIAVTMPVTGEYDSFEAFTILVE